MLVEEIQTALLNEHSEAIYRMIREHHPADIALALEELEDEEVFKFVSFISDKALALILETQISEELQVKIVEAVPFARMLNVFTYMSQDDIVDILGNLSIWQRKQFLNMMKNRDSDDLEKLLAYDPDTAGGLMTTEFIALNENLTVYEAFETIRKIAPEKEVIETLFVVDAKTLLKGTVDIRDIFTKSDQQKLSEILNPNVISVTPTTDQEEVSLIVTKYNLSVVPVVNNKNRILGIITNDDIIHVINEEYTEDMYLMGGVDSEETLDSPVFESVKRRLPWLVINLFTAFLASSVINLFSDTISQMVALAAAMPIVAGRGGNAGTQTVTIVVRALALGEVDWGDWRGMLKEIGAGFANGLITGGVAAIALMLMYGNVYLGVVIILAMIVDMVIAGIFGYFIPLAVKKFRGDPALVSTVFLTTATDVGGFFSFLGLATLFMPLLV